METADMIAAFTSHTGREIRGPLLQKARGLATFQKRG